jgi:hypothetical protein
VPKKEINVKKFRTLLLAAVFACAAMVALVPAANAAPAKGFEEFAGCPKQPDVPFCMRSVTTGGHLKIGATNTPISKPITLSGGLRYPDQHIVYNAQGGLTGDPLEVPGGLSGLTGLSEFLINLITLGAHKVYAKPVLVGDPVFDGVNLTLPMKVNLLNPFLVSGCSIGSAAAPLTLNVTTGTTSPPPPAKPITGRTNNGVTDPKNPGITILPDLKLVDNAFAAPKANTCDLLGFGLITALVNTRAGLPSAAGNNEAIMDHTDIRLAPEVLVYP